MMEGKRNLRDGRSGDDGEKVIVNMLGQYKKKFFLILIFGSSVFSI